MFCPLANAKELDLSSSSIRSKNLQVWASNVSSFKAILPIIIDLASDAQRRLMFALRVEFFPWQACILSYKKAI